MDTLTPGPKSRYRWVQKEVNLPKIISRGSRHKIVKPIQEWLCYHGFKTGVDQDFGPATQKLVERFFKTRIIARFSILIFHIGLKYLIVGNISFPVRIHKILVNCVHSP
jgi:hypothetical protein